MKSKFLNQAITKETADEIIAGMKKLSDDWLGILLWYRDEKDGSIRSLLNGREFGYQDVEHMLVS